MKTRKDRFMAQEFRRVVTGHDENGKAIVVSDKTATQYLERPNRPGVRLTNFWIERGSHAQYDGPTETCSGNFCLASSSDGSTFRCVEFLPVDPEAMKTLDGKSAFSEIGGRCEYCRERTPSFYPQHRLAGLCHCSEGRDLDDDGRRGRRSFAKGREALIQLGNNHAWSNRGTEPCVIAFVLVDGVTQRDAPDAAANGISTRGKTISS